MERPVSGAVDPQMTRRTRTLWGPQPGRMGREEEESSGLKQEDRRACCPGLR